MSDNDLALIEEIRSGKKKVMSRLEYLFNNWTPIIALVIFLIGGIFWFANANGRMFTSEQMRYETEQNTVAAKQRSLDKLDDRYVKKDELKELKGTLETLNKSVIELKIELAKRR